MIGQVEAGVHNDVSQLKLRSTASLDLSQNPEAIVLVECPIDFVLLGADRHEHVVPSDSSLRAL